MALLAFEDSRSSPVADLLDVAQRQKTASELNAAILASQAQVRRAGRCPLCWACAPTFAVGRAEATMLPVAHRTCKGEGTACTGAGDVVMSLEFPGSCMRRFSVWQGRSAPTVLFSGPSFASCQCRT